MDHFSSVNSSMNSAVLEVEKNNKSIPAPMKNGVIPYDGAIRWFDQELNITISFSTGRVSAVDSEFPKINPDQSHEVGLSMHQALDKKSFVGTRSLRIRYQIELSLFNKLYNRLMMISE